MMADGGSSRVVVLSPHLDDAVFSAWHAVGTASGGSILVISLFAGVPAAGFVTPLDRAHGAHESAAWVQRRRREDAEVLGPGVSTVHLDALDLQYRMHSADDLGLMLETGPSDFLLAAASRPGLRTTPDDIARIVPPIDADATVYAPLGVGGHPDHMDVARYVVGLRDRVKEVRLFADTPYFLRHGLPTAIGGVGNPDADTLIARAWDDLGVPPSSTSPEHVVLDHADVNRKLDALRGYRTEFAAIDDDFDGVPSDPDLMRHELYWTLR